MTKVNTNKKEKFIDINNLLQTLSQEYYIKAVQPQLIKIHQYQEGYMNTCLKLSFNKSQAIIVVIYNANKYQGEKSIEKLDNCYIAAEILNQNGIACRIPQKNKKQERLTLIKPYPESLIHLMGVYKYLNGKTLPWEGYTRRHLTSLGYNMKKIHKIWKSSNDKLNLEDWNNYLKKDSFKLKNYFIKNNHTIEQKLAIKINFDELDKIIENIALPNLPNQLIHYDFVRGNILFSEKKEKDHYPISGILDFEKVMYAPVEIDIARTLSFLLVDCKHKSEEQVIFYFLTQGYNNKNLNSNIQIGDLREAMIYFWLRDLWKYLTNNPYEYLNKNYHYIQTKKRLLKSNLIKLI